MNHKELKELIEFLVEKDITEFELERGDVKVRVKRAGEQLVTVAAAGAPQFVVQPPPVVALPTTGAPGSAGSGPAGHAPKEQTPVVEEGVHTVRSPIVGTFYECPSPGSPPFVKVGDTVEPGQVLCIVEAMKLMNEIESDVAGEIVKRMVNNGQPIEYGQELFAIRRK